jgi:hypothetical protein
LCDSCEWFETLTELNELCLDNDYQWANEKLSRIADLIEKKQHINKKQVNTIDNIKARTEG